MTRSDFSPVPCKGGKNVISNFPQHFSNPPKLSRTFTKLGRTFAHHSGSRGFSKVGCAPRRKGRAGRVGRSYRQGARGRSPNSSESPRRRPPGRPHSKNRRRRSLPSWSHNRHHPHVRAVCYAPRPQSPSPRQNPPETAGCLRSRGCQNSARRVLSPKGRAWREGPRRPCAAPRSRSPSAGIPLLRPSAVQAAF